jgi:ferric-dicitrate binding protein FerR (iron transport regulator)
MDRDAMKAEILRYLDGDLTADEERALAAAIRGDKEAEDLFAELMRFNGNIATVLSEAAGEKKAKRELGHPAPKPRNREMTWVLVGAAAAVAVIVLSMLASSMTEVETPKKPKPAPVVKREEPPSFPPSPSGGTEGKPPLPPPPSPAPLPHPEPRALPKDPVPQPLPEPPKPEKPAPPPQEPTATPKTPEPAPPPPTTKAIVAVATLEGVKGEVAVKKEPARDGQTVEPGQSIETGAAGGVALRFSDGTRVEIGPDSRIDQVTNGKGKKIEFDHGMLSAEVKKQPAGEPLVVTTPHAEAKVLGTKFLLTVKSDSTRLDVQEGRVKLTLAATGSSTEVGAGTYAIAAPGTRLVAKRIPPANPRLLLNEEFDAPEGRWELIDGGFPTTMRGKVEVDVSRRPGDSYAAGGWHIPGGVRLKKGFPVPFRLSVDVESSVKDDSLNVVAAFVPESQKAGVIKNELGVRLRGADYAILVENVKGKPATAGGPWPYRARWTVELDRQEIRFWADGKEIGRQAHNLTFTENYRFELHGAAKDDGPASARVTFDNVKVEPIDK